MIIDLQKSPLKNKRFRVILNDGSKYDFGLKDGFTYIDGETNEKRLNYLKRHLGNPTEKKLIIDLIPSPALFSATLLWGKSRNINKNISSLNTLF